MDEPCCGAGLEVVPDVVLEGKSGGLGDVKCIVFPSIASLFVIVAFVLLETPVLLVGFQSFGVCT